MRVLIAERHLTIAESLAKIIEAAGNAEVTAQVTSAAEALESGRKSAPDVALIDLALSPDCALVSALHRLSPETRIIVMSERAAPATGVIDALASGAVGAIYRDASMEELSRILMSSSRHNPAVPGEATAILLESYLNSLSDRRKRDLATIEALAAAVEVRDLETGQHLRRVTSLAETCLDKIDPDLARNEEVRFGFTLHDVGKIGVPDAVLNKVGPLTDEEWKSMRQHPELGVKIVEPIGFSSAATDIILSHHERFDGGGYPFGLAREEIPITARAFAVVDAFDAMTSDRPYRSAMPTDRALELIHANAGTQFDPEVADVLIDLTA
ncbi:MAG: HD domain-containing protein [Actinomycetota bacterium]|nr:HD domain-containing protein [Actinomycetota bacterium]